MSEHAHKLKVFTVEVEDKPGALAKVTGDLKDCGVNLKALWAWGEGGGKATAMFVPEEASIVEGCACETCSTAKGEAVLWAEAEDQPGALHGLLELIAAKGINIRALQALAVGGKGAAVLMFESEAVLDQALEALGGECCKC